MKIQSDVIFKSLNKINAINLPDFVIISGINGSGKTQLLQGIASNNSIIVTNDNGTRLHKTKFVNSQSLTPNNSASVNWDNLKQSSQNILNQFISYKNQKTNKWLAEFSKKK